MPLVAQPAASHAVGLAELERLARLRDQGAISRHEYDAAKAKILAAWAGTEPGGTPPAAPEYSLLRQLTHPPVWARAGAGIAAAVLIITALAALARRDVAAPDDIPVSMTTPPAATAPPRTGTGTGVGTTAASPPSAPSAPTANELAVLVNDPSKLADAGTRPYWGAVAYERIYLKPYEEAYVFQSHKQMPSPMWAYPCAALAVGFSWVARAADPNTPGQTRVEFLYYRQMWVLMTASGSMGQATTDWCGSHTVRNPNPFPVVVTLTYVALVQETATPRR
jgi:hypothetical protein